MACYRSTVPKTFLPHPVSVAFPPLLVSNWKFSLESFLNRLLIVFIFADTFALVPPRPLGRSHGIVWTFAHDSTIYVQGRLLPAALGPVCLGRPPTAEHFPDSQLTYRHFVLALKHPTCFITRAGPYIFVVVLLAYISSHCWQLLNLQIRISWLSFFIFPPRLGMVFSCCYRLLLSTAFPPINAFVPSAIRSPSAYTLREHLPFRSLGSPLPGAVFRRHSRLSTATVPFEVRHLLSEWSQPGARWPRLR